MEGLTFDLNSLPLDCIATIISFTTPRDGCRLSLLSTTFKTAADSDAVWESFLPSEYQDLIPTSLSFTSKKQLYLYLCQNPVLIHDGRKSLWLEKSSGKKCYMVSPRDMHIAGADTEAPVWRWISMPKARFGEVAKLVSVCWFEMRGKIDISMLSPSTHYKAYLVYKVHSRCGFEFFPVKLSVGLVGTSQGSKQSAYLDPKRRQGPVDWRYMIAAKPIPTQSDDDQFPKVREDGWLEVEMGDFFNEGCIDDDAELEMSAIEIEGGNWKHGFILQGIEIRACHAAESTCL